MLHKKTGGKKHVSLDWNFFHSNQVWWHKDQKISYKIGDFQNEFKTIQIVPQKNETKSVPKIIANILRYVLENHKVVV